MNLADETFDKIMADAEEQKMKDLTRKLNDEMDHQQDLERLQKIRRLNAEFF